MERVLRIQTFLLFLCLYPLVSKCELSLVTLSASHLSTGGGKVFASSDTTVYLYSSDLVQQQIVSLESVVALTTTQNGQWLVVCLENGDCSVINGSNINADPSLTVNGIVGDSSTALFTTPDTDGQRFYTGSYGAIGGSGNIRTRYSEYGFAESQSMDRSVTFNELTTFRANGGRDFYYGFFQSGYAYHVVSDPTGGVLRELRIIRVCNISQSDSFDSQYELVLDCGGVSTSVNIRGISVFNEETLVIGRAVSGGSRVCTYNLSDINSMMDSSYQTCVVDETGNKNVQWFDGSAMCNSGFSGSPTMCNFATEPTAIAPSDSLPSDDLDLNSTVLDGLTATLALTADNINLLYVGFTTNSKYYIDKYHWTNGSLILLSEVEVDSEVNNIIWSQDSEYVYFTTTNEEEPTLEQIGGLKLENCSSSTSCDECVGLGDPLCGWCVLERKCSRSSFCMDSDSSGRYLSQGDGDSCIDSVTIEPSEFVLELELIPYQISVEFTPPLTISKLSGEEYFCVFTNEEKNIEIKSIIDDDNYCNVTEVISKLDDISLSTTFGVFNNRTNIQFITVDEEYIFYNCSAVSKCSECIMTDGVCGWCQLDFTCTGDNSTCTGGADNWLTISDDETYLDICPLLVPNSPVTDYTQPVDVKKDLQLTTLNTPSLSGLSYQCVFGGDARPAIPNNDTSVYCDIENVLQFTGSNTQTQTQSFALRQTNNKNYDIEISTGDTVNVILYNCLTLADSCSKCLGQNIGTGFECGWCSSNNQCTEQSECNSPVTMTGNCDDPVITTFDPVNGPPQGGTNITINGTDLGAQFSDIVSVTIGSHMCTPIEEEYRTGERIVCNIDTINRTTEDSDSISIKVSTSSGDKNANSNEQFMFLLPSIDSFFPTFGPRGGSTRVMITGNNLDIGNTDQTRVIMRESINRRKKRQNCPDTECNIMSINTTYITCYSGSAGSDDCLMIVAVEVNNNAFDSSSIFTYKPDPTFTDLDPEITIPAGGIKLTFTGSNFDVVQSPMITITDTRFNIATESCLVENNDTNLLICTAPQITPINDAIDTAIQYKVVVDGATGPDSSIQTFELVLKRDPTFSMVIDRELQENDIIRIQGANIDSVQKSEIIVYIGDENCQVDSTAETLVTCQPPSKDEGTFLVSVRVGNNLFFNETTDEWMVTFTGNTTTGSSSPVSPPVAIIGGSVGGGVLIIAVVFFIVIAIVVVSAIRQAKLKDRRYITLMSQMESMELEMADQCKQAFAELQTDLGELVTEDALDSNQLPFHNFPTYATKVFFPSAGIHHPVMSEPRIPHGMSNEDMTTLLDEFRSMIFDKSFLISFVKTLEAQPRFSLQEKSTIASLIMVACLKDVSYATEILQALLGDLIRYSITQSRNHPKLLLRRTESVAEKLLTNWFCVTLYPYMLDHAGASLFVLFKAVKAQLEKGPIDVINGEARNSLSEEKLLRQALEFKLLECEVDMANSNELLGQFSKRPVGLEPSNALELNRDIQTIKLLDTDSISQTKEKILDFIYCNRPVSERPSISDVELQLCRGNVGISLRDQDSTSVKDGEWTMINTLGHYNIPEMADSAIEDPKKPTPRFKLVQRGTRPLSGPNFDVPGTIIASASVTSQTSLLAAAAQTFPTNNKLFHLVKPDIGEGEQKIATEVFLTRLLATKRILQPYVDDLFQAIFTVPRGKPLPKAIKVLFDFLDMQAANLGINDPEVLHTWKTNSLPLRFWVNLIKNPDFVFDINKSATVDACFTVIAQAYIDACSTSDVKYTKDTPSARLLYANEVKLYKNEVLQFYSQVQSLPHNSYEELQAYFQETLDPFFQEFEKHEGIHFYPESALLELYRYAVQYGEEISDTLSEDRLTMLAAQFNSLRQKYNVNSSSM